MRRFSKTLLTILVVLSACFLAQYLVMGPKGDVIGGWSIDETQLHIGFARLLYPFFAGILLLRIGKLIKLKGAFAICSLLLVAIFSIPRIGGSGHLWMNGLYEAVCIILLFPLIVSIGAGSNMSGKYAIKICKFLGALSYPLYIIHYPLIYLHLAWVTKNKIPISTGLLGGVVVLITAIVIAYMSLKFYDEPVRKWLTSRFLKNQ